MDQYEVLDLCVAKQHAFDEVAQRQEPWATHGLLKAGICPSCEDLRLHLWVV